MIAKFGTWSGPPRFPPRSAAAPKLRGATNRISNPIASTYGITLRFDIEMHSSKIPDGTPAERFLMRVTVEKTWPAREKPLSNLIGRRDANPISFRHRVARDLGSRWFRIRNSSNLDDDAGCTVVLRGGDVDNLAVVREDDVRE